MFKKICMVLTVVSIVMPLAFAQSDQTTATDQITLLMANLCAHSVKPSDVLDPYLSSKLRNRNLVYFDDSAYSLKLAINGKIMDKSINYVDVPVKVYFKSDTKEMNTDANIEFVNRSGVWYFANYNFLGFPKSMIIIIILGLIIGIGYAGIVLILHQNLRRAGNYNFAQRIAIFVPIFWPKMLRRSRTNA